MKTMRVVIGVAVVAFLESGPSKPCRLPDLSEYHLDGVRGGVLEGVSKLLDEVHVTYYAGHRKSKPPR